MAYVRDHGNQLAIVHGERDSQTGKVRQRVLFKICSKPEAMAAIGERSNRGWNLERLLERRYRKIRFDWPKIRAGIEERMEDLPDIYPYREEEMQKRFREGLCTFTRNLGLADPQSMYSAAELIRAHRHELEYLRDLIDRRLLVCDQSENEWNADNEFCWRHRTQDEDVPPEVIEHLSKLYGEGELDRVESLARLFVDSFEDYADGHNYLGLVARDRGFIDEAVEHFERAITEGRKLFPKRFPKKHYWLELDTRPYMRGLRNLAQTLPLAGRFDEALDVCERLYRECGDTQTAFRIRAGVELVAGHPDEAVESAKVVLDIWSECAYIAAFASHELGENDNARAWFLHGILTSPRAGSILLGLETDEPRSYREVQDHNTGVQLYAELQPFIEEMSAETQDFFERVVTHPRTQSLLDERRVVNDGWREDRKLAARREDLRSIDFAFRVATEIGAHSGGNP